MRKSLLLIAILVCGVTSAQAELAPLNVQNAQIDTDKPNQFTFGLDWFRDHVEVGGADVRTNTFNLPRIDYRRSLDIGIPVRIGMNTSIAAGAGEIGGGGGTEILENSAFGFGNLGLTLEAAIINEDNIAITPYINQTFALTHNDLQVANVLRPVSGTDAYGFQTGAEYKLKLCKDLNWFGDVAYRFDVPDVGKVQHGLVYYNEAVWGGDDFGLSVGVLGNTVYTDDLGTDLRLVPGIIAPVGDNVQARVGFPIGLTSDSSDFGVQASLYSVF